MRDNTFKMITRKMPIITTLILVTLLPSSAIQAWSLFPRTYAEAEPFGGRVLDAETGQPISEAVLVMKWPRSTSTFAGTHRLGIMEILEAVTDETGRYKIPGWKKRYEDIGEGGFLKSDGELYVFASGYWPRMLPNKPRDDDGFSRGGAWKSDWDSKTIELKPVQYKKFSGVIIRGSKQEEEYNKNFSQWRKYLSTTESYLSISDIPRCSWIKMPNYYLVEHRIKVKNYKILYPGWQSISRRPLVRTYLYGIFSEEQNCTVEPVAFFLSHGMTKDEFEECCNNITKQQPRVQLETITTIPAGTEVGNTSGVKK